jgi:hypothetical protein
VGHSVGSVTVFRTNQLADRPNDETLRKEWSSVGSLGGAGRRVELQYELVSLAVTRSQQNPASLDCLDGER